MLSDSVKKIKGVGKKLAEDLALMNIHTVEELLLYLPYRYDVFEIKPLIELIHEDKVTIMGRVANEPSLTFFGKKKSRLFFNVMVENVAVKAVLFNKAFAKKHMKPGDIVTLTGKWDAHRLQITVNKYKVGTIQQNDAIQPIYSIKGDVSNHRFRKIMKDALTEYEDEIEERLPEHYLVNYKLPVRKDALKIMHFPPNRTSLKHARRRFTYEEFLLFQLKIQLLRKLNRDATVGQKQQFSLESVHQFKNSLPFSLTNAQEKALEQILNDMQSPYRMNRLLQGDVGSGKTIVAAISLYASITANRQGALMVPTEILAEQHYISLKEIYGDSVTIALLTGSVKGKKREKILSGLKQNEIDIVIGTHALIQEDVHFHELGLVIIDEQHRFGVNQRRMLRDKGKHADVLFMTATPIPRTLAITAFGDMDVSIIDEMPAGRQEIETYWVKENMLERILDFIQGKVRNGEQAYVICPLIEESDKLDIQNAVDLYEQLTTYYPPEIEIGLMHGKLHPNEKDAVMKAFMQNKLHVLVSTTVIEVGVNVPNATVMVIYDAERFGLAQLHQLRGRVGRGSLKSYCILVAEPNGMIGKERMRIMTETTDGFFLAEEDLKLRGPGDFFGKKQSGLPEFKVADMVHDYRALETARNDASQILEKNLLVTDVEYRPLLSYLEEEGVFSMKLD